MKYIIIGLGNYGGVLAEELSVLGHEVIGVDTNEHRVDVLKDKIATSFIIDATDEQSLSVLPLKMWMWLLLLSARILVLLCVWWHC